MITTITKNQQNSVWHTPKDNPPQEGKKIIFLWGEGNNIKDLNQNMGVLTTAFRDIKIVRGDGGWKTWLFENVKLWAYVEDLLPESI